MTTLSSLSSPLDTMSATRASQAGDAVFDTTPLKTAEETEKVAKKFEALLIHNMLKAMRTTTLGDKPSNERAMYDDMFDQEISKKLSESGGIGVASAISRQLNSQYGIKDKESLNELSTVEQSMHALSNHPNTLARNGQLTSSLANLGQYQALMSRVGSISPADETNNDSTALSVLGESKKNFINTLMPDAKRSAARLGVKPDVVIAIAALETGWGKHVIETNSGASSHNLFGIKAHDNTMPYTMHKTTEYINNKPVTLDEPFRRYDDNSSSVNDFADFLLTNPRYKDALKASTDNHSFLRELQRAGYATDPEYANKAINVLQQIETIRQRPVL